MGTHPITTTAQILAERPPPPTTAGGAIRRWRDARGLSQLRLSMRAGVSARHLSFIESGRSVPGRDVLVRLAGALELGLRDQNELLALAGFAPLHPPRRLTDESMSGIRDVLEFLLERHEPNSAIVVDGIWNVLMFNRAHVEAMRLFAPRSRSAAGEPTNLVEELFDPDALRPAIGNFDLVAHVIHERLECMVAAAPLHAEARALLERIEAFGPMPPRPREADRPSTVLLMPIEFRRGDARMTVFSTRTGFTVPLDATLQELHLETFFPADRESERLIRSLSGAE